MQYQGTELRTGEGRADLVTWEAQNIPVWGNHGGVGAAINFFVAAERYESSKWVAYTEWRFALPRELSRGEQLDAARVFLRAAFGTAHAYVWAFHEPRAADGGSQPHVHVLWNARIQDGIERTPQQFFRRWDSKVPSRGGAEKHAALNHMGAVKAARVLYTDVINLHLEQAAQTARLHPDRLTARGIDYRTKEPRLSIKDSDALKYEGRVTAAMQKVLDHRAARQPFLVKERNQARLYWEQRKAFLGITRDMPPAQQLAQILLKRHGAVERVPARYQELLQSPPRHVRTRIPAPAPTRTTDLLQRLDQLREREEAVGTGTRLRVHLTDEREPGMGW